MLHDAGTIKPQNIGDHLRILTGGIDTIVQISRIIVEALVHDCEVVGGPDGGQVVDGFLATGKCEWVMLDVTRIDVREEGERDVLLDPELLHKVVPDFYLVFCAGWLWWAVGFAGYEGKEGESEWEESGQFHRVG